MRLLAVYPGTFDPPTLGHLDVIERAAKLFDKVVVGVGVNSSKSPLLTADDRVKALTLATEGIKGVTVETFTGLLVDFCHQKHAKSIIRGLRATADFEYEFQMAMINRRLAEDVDSVFLMTRWDYSYLSSSMVREVALLGGDFRTLVPPAVVPFVEAALAHRATMV